MADDIKARRKALGLSRQQLADLASTTPSGVWSVENGKNPRGGDAVRVRVVEALERREGGVIDSLTDVQRNITDRVVGKATRAAKTTAKIQEDFAAAHPDWVVSYEWNGLQVNDAVTVAGAPGVFRFEKHVLNTRTGKEHVDVVGGKGGRQQQRAFDASRVTATRKERRKRGPGEDVDPKSKWTLKVGEHELSFATYEDAKHQADAHEIPAMDPERQILRIINPHGTVIFEYPAQDGLSRVARERALGLDPDEHSFEVDVR